MTKLEASKSSGIEKENLVTTKNQPEKEETVVLLRPENANKKYEALFLEIDSGQIKLPMFQREFVWNKEQSARLIDSVLKGYEKFIARRSAAIANALNKALNPRL